MCLRSKLTANKLLLNGSLMLTNSVIEAINLKEIFYFKKEITLLSNAAKRNKNAKKLTVMLLTIQWIFIRRL